MKMVLRMAAGICLLKAQHLVHYILMHGLSVYKIRTAY